MSRPFGVLFVCLGNICRSPTAEGVFRARVEAAGLAGRIAIDSAGTASWHAGKPPDPRTVAAAARRGYDLSALRARQVEPADFARFDLLLAMDADNLAHLRRMKPAATGTQLGLVLEHARRQAAREVPDPWAGGPEGFEQVLDLLEDAADGLLATVRERLS